MNVNAPIDWVITVPHVEAVVSNNDLVADRLPLATFVESLVHPTVSAKGPLANPLLDSQVAISRKIVIKREKLLSRPQFHRGSLS